MKTIKNKTQITKTIQTIQTVKTKTQIVNIIENRNEIYENN